MSTSEEMRAFVAAGYEQYGIAKDTVMTFESELQERLIRLFEAKDDWTHFQPRRGERGRGRAVHCGLWPNPGRPAIWACNYDDRGFSLELGIRWGTHESGRPMLYTTRWETRFRKLHLSQPTAPVQNRDGHLIVVVTVEFDLDASGPLLLAETDRALAGGAPDVGEDAGESR